MEDTESKDTGEYIVQITSKGSILKRFVSDSQKEIYIDVIDYLVREHDLTRNINIPYVPGDKKSIISDKPENEDGSEMHRWQKISDGLYLNTNLKKESKIRYLAILVNSCEIDIYLEKGWT